MDSSRLSNCESKGNLKKKLEDAHSDLENLKKTLRDLKTSNERKSGNNIRNKPFLSDSYNGINSSLSNRNDNSFVELNDNDPSFIGQNKYSDYYYNSHVPLKTDSGSIIDGRAVINNFKEILKQSNKVSPQSQPNNLNFPLKESRYNNNSSIGVNSQLQKNPVNNSQRSNVDFNSTNLASQTNQNANTYSTFLNKVTSTSMKDEIERLKISNQVLTKSNLDLKNQIRLTTMELESLRENNVFNFSNNLNFDQNLTNFIENLKTALNSCQMSNGELNIIIESLQKKNSDVSNENSLIKERIELSRQEVESFNKKLSQTKMNLEDSLNQNKQFANEIGQLRMMLQEKEEFISQSDEKINNLISINECYNKNKSDLISMNENFKTTIENLKKSNIEFEKEKSLLKDKIDDLQNTLAGKDFEIGNLTNTTESYEKEKLHLIQEGKVLRDEINNREKYIQEMQYNFKNLILDSDRNKNKIETFNINMEEKDHTVENLKSSLNFITQTLEEYKSEHETLKYKYDQNLTEIVKMTKSLEINEKKIRDLNNLVDCISFNKDDLQKINLQLETECNEKTNKLNNLQFEFDILTQKFSDLTELADRLKEENKNNKMNKITEDFNINIIKNNDEKLKLIFEMKQEVKRKTNETEELKRNFESKLSDKEEKIKELSLSLNSLLNREKDKERELINELKNYKYDNEKLKKDIKKLSTDYEYEKKTLTESTQKLQSDYNNLAMTLKRVEETYYEQISRNKLLENSLMQLQLINTANETDLDRDKVMPYNNDLPKFYIGDKMQNKNMENKYKGKQSKTSHNSNPSITSYRNKSLNIPLNRNLSSKKSSSKELLTGLIKINSTESKCEENPHLFSVFDNQRILSFDLIEKQFKFMEFEDQSDFSNDYMSDGSLTLNHQDGIFIVTGKDNNSFYHYTFPDNTMNKLHNLNHSHNGGALVYYNNKNTILCLSGKHNHKVEKFSLDDKTHWSYLPDLICDRTNAGYIVINNKFIYSLFGYSFLTASYLNTVERLNLEDVFCNASATWQEVKITVDRTHPFSVSLKSFFCAEIEDTDEIWILGGYNGQDFEENRNILKFNLEQNFIELNIEKKIPENIIPVSFSRENQVFLYKDSSDCELMSIVDDSFKVHIFDHHFIEYEVVDFSY